MKQLPWLEDSGGVFPPASEAFKEPNGLLCAGGDLVPE
ncbi:MAG TPA: leucyl/phenylalanyl-tRNA--protein transferase, partial [Gammaproteobacteria bacterium]|nr:leucyl/phenylalanyl-tRNA--protein transferase [Gammaproteobacteria bacterium]